MKRFLLWSALFVVGCGDSPTAPSAPPVAPAPAQIAGEWNGRYREIRCTTRPGSPNCSQRFKSGEPEFDFTLTISQSGNRITGTFDVKPRPFEAHAKGDLSGVVNGTAVELTALLPWQSNQDPGVFGTKEIQNFGGVADEANRTVTGSFVMVHKEQDFVNFHDGMSDPSPCEAIKLEEVSENDVRC